MLQSGCTTSINHFTGKQNNPSKQKAAEKLSRHTKEEPGDCVRVSADGYVFAIEGDIQMKKEKKRATIKWRGVQQGIVVGGSGRSAEAEGRSELSGGGVGAEGVGKMCVKENKRAKREGGGLAQTKGGGGLIKYVPMFV